MTNNSKPQLFLLHFAGGSCYSFEFLKNKSQNSFDFISLELPGRGKRFHERLLSNKKEAIQDYVKQIKALRNEQPYLIYGHSMGATLGLSVVKEMELLGDSPLTFIATGNAGPGVEKKTVIDDAGQKIKNYLLDDKSFKEVLQKLGGIPEDVLLNDELYFLFSPIIRSDFSILENEELMEIGLRINTPIYALMGTQEESASEISNWQKYTSSRFDADTLDGGHFFIYNYKEILIKLFNVLLIKKKFS